MLTALPSGTESARPFLPARDFASSKAFYEAMGFTMELDGDDVAIYRIGSTSFLLQNHFQKQWAENFMMQLLVDDLDAWWEHIVSLDLPTRFGVPGPKPPTMQPWGLRIAYVVDPSGVLWHVAQRRPEVTHDL
jgi:predicted enzyme related to lactoylglutathione lyase